MLRELFNEFVCIISSLYPEKCLFCGEIIYPKNRRYVCDECDRTHSPDMIIKSFENNTYEGVASAFRYGGEIREMVHAYKFSSMPQYAKVFAKYMYQTIIKAGYKGIDIVTWIPSRNSLARKRGYNQSELLAREVCLTSGGRFPEPCPVLKKVRRTKHQYEVGINERLKNIEGAYEVLETVCLNGKNVLIIDDVYTSGATAHVCSKALKQAGANKVYVATFGYAGY